MKALILFSYLHVGFKLTLITQLKLFIDLNFSNFLIATVFY